MTPCARGCCWTAFQVCSRQRDCRCHWDDQRPARVSGGADRTYKDPTSQEAIANIMRERKRRNK